MKLKKLFFAALALQGESMRSWSKKRGFSPSTVKEYLRKGFPSGKRRVVKGKLIKKEILKTIEQQGLIERLHEEEKDVI